VHHDHVGLGGRGLGVHRHRRRPEEALHLAAALDAAAPDEGLELVGELRQLVQLHVESHRRQVRDHRRAALARTGNSDVQLPRHDR